MEKKFYMFGGSPSSPEGKGVRLYEYVPENGDLVCLKHAFPDVKVGQLTFDKDTSIAYIVEEIPHHYGKVGGGGYVWAFKVDIENNDITLLNTRPSLGNMPAYIWIDKSKKYAVVAHHCHENHANKIVKRDDGSYDVEVIFEDAPLVLFRLNEDGSFGEVCDAVVIPGDQQPGMRTHCHLHWVQTDPSGELYLVNDCGSDRIFSFKIDRENGKLVFLDEVTVGYGYWPRYGLFHPTKPIYYCNNEQKPILDAFTYDVETGRLEKMYEKSMLIEGITDGVHAEPSDIVFSKDYKHIYAAIRVINRIAVFDLNDNGTFTLRQNVTCEGSHQRGLCVSPDNKYLYLLNRTTNHTIRYNIAEDGTLDEGEVINSDGVSTLVNT